jgi:hypothetical protein
MGDPPHVVQIGSTLQRRSVGWPINHNHEGQSTRGPFRPWSKTLRSPSGSASPILTTWLIMQINRAHASSCQRVFDYLLA